MTIRERDLGNMIHRAAELRNKLSKHQNATKLGELNQELIEFLKAIEYGEFIYLQSVAMMFHHCPKLNELYLFPNGTMRAKIMEIKL